MYLEPKSKRTPLFYYLCCSFFRFFSLSRWLLFFLPKQSSLPLLLTHLLPSHIHKGEKCQMSQTLREIILLSILNCLMEYLYAASKYEVFVHVNGGIIKVTHFYCCQLFCIATISRNEFTVTAAIRYSDTIVIVIFIPIYTHSTRNSTSVKIIICKLFKTT